MRLVIDQSGIAEARLQSTVTSLYESLPQLAEEPFFKLPNDVQVLEQVQKLVKEKITPHLKYIILVGIGGSSEGAQAIYEALGVGGKKKIIFLEGLEPNLPSTLADLFSQIKHPEEILVTVISFSGTTVETRLNAELVTAELAKRWPKNYEERIVHVSQQAGADLMVPPGIGGRYSLFAHDVLFPLAAAGIDIAALRAGAAEISEWLLAPDLSNPAILLAALDYLALEDGRGLLVDWFDRPSLESLGKWGRQLVAESLGKDGDGPTPLLAVAENDRHSLLQLDLGGPDNKFFHFISTDRDTGNEKIIKVKRAINEAVLQSYRRARRPYLELILPDLSPRSLGAYCQLRFAATVLFAHLLDVNPFNQPDVEGYKNSLKGLL